MKQAWSSDIDPLEPDEFRLDSGRGTSAVVPSEGELPGGTATGSMLHEILEFIPFESFKPTPSLNDWGQRQEIADIVTAALDRNGIDPSYRDDALAIVYRALTIDIPLDSGRSIAGLCQCQNVLREMEFLFPFPEDGHPPLSDPRRAKSWSSNEGLSKDLWIWSLSTRNVSTSPTGRAISCRLTIWG